MKNLFKALKKPIQPEIIINDVVHPLVSPLYNWLAFKTHNLKQAIHITELELNNKINALASSYVHNMSYIFDKDEIIKKARDMLARDGIKTFMCGKILTVTANRQDG